MLQGAWPASPGDHERGRRCTSIQAQTASAAEATVSSTNDGFPSSRGLSALMRQTWAAVINPKITPVVMTYGFMDSAHFRTAPVLAEAAAQDNAVVRTVPPLRGFLLRAL